jgi:hypothetical protein
LAHIAHLQVVGALHLVNVAHHCAASKQ